MGRKQVYKVTDGQDTWVYDDIESALEHIREGLYDATSEETMTIEVAFITQAEYDAIPVQ